MFAPRPTSPMLASPFARAFLVVLSSLVVIALVTGCTGRPSTPDQYGDTTERNFLRGCTDEAEGVSDIDEVCRCTYDAIVEEIPYDEFKRVNSELSDNPARLPEPFQALLDGCQEGDAPG